ncbi:dienelactone hydrolase family protein [Cohnella rhizosphaerae]|uniref:Acetyl xylan esterase domain-containing protein n=1 Tax=Cohnella rhizosphaerae TaxID=1457232 RepID=A0A9X4KUU9_9BACL|nr:hypothetical protein [Cohnella rhizosphaerae]MDG0811280.1 hypothetical protein [Cohnella rhizosphaerae]
MKENASVVRGPDAYMRRLYAESQARREQASAGERFDAMRLRLRRRLRAALGLAAARGGADGEAGGGTDRAGARSLSEAVPDAEGSPSGEPMFDPPAARLLEREACEHYTRERIELQTDEGLTMPVYVLIPTAGKGPYPIVVACHGHGYGSREAVGLAANGSPLGADTGIHRQFAVELALRGFAVAVPELLGFGDRRLREDIEAGPGVYSCFRIAAHLLMHARTLAGLRIAETLRAVDYMSARPECDAERIGCMGFSGGGARRRVRRCAR